MASVSESIVREYFELNGFLIRQHRKYVAHSRDGDDHDIDFFVLNPHVESMFRATPFVLSTLDLARIDRAIVVVKGWHTETFSSARLSGTPEIFRFVQPRTFKQAAKAFGKDGAPLKILVLPALPHDAAERDKAIEVLRAKGVDAVLPFRTILQTVIEQVEANRNYQKSDLLQILRILKNYDFFREPQMELFKAKARRK